MTYSIVARDAATGDLGVAVQSHYFAVGPVVPWLRPGVGAVATQAMVDVGYGPRAIELLAAGRAPADVLGELTAADDNRAIRQVAVVNASGAVAVHTGERCIGFAGHRTGDGWSVQANMMATATVWDAMAAAFVSSATNEEDLAFRLVAALDAGEAEGGDLRGMQSAALVVVSGDPSTPAWDRLYDVRVDDAAEPLAELRRLVEMRRAYRHEDHESHAVGGNPELRFWRGVALATDGQVDEAKEILAPIFAVNGGWRELLRRLPAAGLFPSDPAVLQPLLE